MEATCRRALELGLRGVAFTEHADFAAGVHAGLLPFEVGAYLEEVLRCRAQFPGLRILSGVELGEPHRHPAEAAQVLAAGPLDRVLGSVHCISWQGSGLDASQMGRLEAADAAAFVGAHLAETLDLVESGAPFQALAHLDYPKRYWPHDQVPYRDQDFEEALRAILGALAARDGALELNTTRGDRLCPGGTVLGWWVEAGGRALAFGSDAHSPERLAGGFRAAAALAEAAGFRPQDDPTGFWRR